MGNLPVEDAMSRLASRQVAAQVTTKRIQREGTRYTLILHQARKKLGLSILEFCLADTIHKLSGNRSSVPGWCHAPKEYLADGLGISRRSVHRYLNALKEKQLIKADPTTGYLRTTEEWRGAVEVVKDRVFGG